MHSQINIRLGTREDCKSIAFVLKTAFEPYQPLYTAAGYALTVLAADALLARWEEGPVWVSEYDGSKIVGTVAAVAHSPALYIRSMAVLPETRGQGIGSGLLCAIEDFARQNGHTTLELCTTPFLHNAIRLYEKFGFRRTGEPHDLGGTPLFDMVKEVGGVDD